MATKQSANKRIRTSERKRIKNRHELSSMKTNIKKVLSTTSKEEGLEKFKKAASVLDKMVSKGVIHRNTAANKKSKLMKHVNSLT
jgi:small subunit ribosomal protein S20